MSSFLVLRIISDKGGGREESGISRVVHSEVHHTSYGQSRAVQTVDRLVVTASLSSTFGRLLAAVIQRTVSVQQHWTRDRAKRTHGPTVRKSRRGPVDNRESGPERSPVHNLNNTSYNVIPVGEITGNVASTCATFEWLGLGLGALCWLVLFSTTMLPKAKKPRRANLTAPKEKQKVTLKLSTVAASTSQIEI
ncbi:hypothetical protein BDN72DRAFT_864425 [Pluteus cervinus]|uniref:Uncharacterized protein n=1 Tax=Pluteus cervinus TaxID=181527 RepID=A0ACD3A436_9AGAR|nr:hypothetical protein BDN72DRAFT_864425 [Pluteus cervinus]